MDKNTKDQQHAPSNGTSDQKSANSSALARRRLLKGAMAATPAVFTLQSGAARAAMSNLQCLAHPPKFNSKEHGVHVSRWTDDGEKPNWKRDKIYGIKVKNAKRQSHYLVEVEQYYNYNKTFEDEYGRKWIAVKVGYDWGYVLDGKQHSNWLWQPYSDYHKTYFFKKRKDVNRYKVVSVDKKGNYVKSHKKGNPVTLSCWTSFASPKSGGKGGGGWGWGWW